MHALLVVISDGGGDNAAIAVQQPASRSVALITGCPRDTGVLETSQRGARDRLGGDRLPGMPGR